LALFSKNVYVYIRKNPRLSEEVDVKENLMGNLTDSDSDSSSLSAKGPWFTKPADSNSSGGIEFEEDSDALDNSSSDESSKEIDTVDSPPSSSLLPTSLQFMYIQMEYCEKSTLRTGMNK
jgi:translation initiation factor 2-alpha kinase 4